MHIVLIYVGILAGVFFEGEMIMISSVIAAHHGYLKLWLVVSIGIAGTFGSDCFYFFLGRRKGKDWINKNQKIKNKAGKVISKLEKYPRAIFFIYRFVYGFRSITPMIIGASQIKTRLFLAFSAMGTIVWAATYSVIGYTFGAVIKSQLGHIEHVEKYIIGVLVLFAIVFIITRRYARNA